MTSHHYRDEPDIPFVLFRPDVKNGVPQDYDHCSLAISGSRSVGEPISVGYDLLDGEVRAAWSGSDGRMHYGVMQPNQEAVRVVMGTDTQKGQLARTIPEAGTPLVITQHRSRESQTETPEEAQRRNARRRELGALRKAGLAPPAKPRPYRPVVASRRRTRGVAVKPAGEAR